MTTTREESIKMMMIFDVDQENASGSVIDLPKMSRLSYASPSEDEDGEISEDESLEDAFDRAEELAMSSYSLLGLQSSSPPPPPSSRHQGTNENSATVVVERRENNNNSPISCETSTHAVDDDSRTSEFTPIPQNASKWLSNFLSQKRSSSTPPPPPTCSLNNDFLLQFDRNSKDMISMRDNTSPAVHESDSGSSDDDRFVETVDTSKSSTLTESPSDSRKSNQLHLFNLPYSMTAKQVASTAEKYDVRLFDVVLNKDANGRPSGSAVASCKCMKSTSSDHKNASTENNDGANDNVSDDTAQMCAFLLADKSFDGRPIRVHTNKEYEAEKQMKRLDNIANASGRYFGSGDISVKCHICGEVGHRMSECLSEDNVMNPCHLCASTQHEAMACNNIVCFQCNQFGHHSRHCQNKRSYGRFSLKPSICTLCGGTTHDKRRCRQNSVAAKKAVEGPQETLECMCCGKIGHAMCLRVPIISRNNKEGMVDLFCPKCGKAGHHADYVINDQYEPSCRQPDFGAAKKKRLNSNSSSRVQGGDRNSSNRNEKKGPKRK